MAESGFAAGQLKSLVERIEHLAMRKLDSSDRQENEALLDLYLSALGMRK